MLLAKGTERRWRFKRWGMLLRAVPRHVGYTSTTEININLGSNMVEHVNSSNQVMRSWRCSVSSGSHAMGTGPSPKSTSP